MERSSNVLMVPADIGWSDLRDWSAIDAIFGKNEQGNVIQAKHLSYAEDKGKLIATIGLKNIVIVETKEALLAIDTKEGSRGKEAFQMKR